MNLLTSNDFSYGTGCGRNDLRVFPTWELIDRQSPLTDVYNTMLLVENDDEIVYGDEFTSAIDINTLYLIPGYIYLADREIYMYNDKATEILYPKLNNGIYYVDLIGRPDGYMPLLYDDNELGKLDLNHNYGAAPILVEIYNSGDMKSLNIYTEQLISSETGINGAIGYSHDGTGIFNSGDIGNYPSYFSPLTKTAKSHEYWRDDTVLAPDTYEYNIQYNRIYFSGDLEGKEILVNYEIDNTPFSIESDLFAFDKVPESFILGLSVSDIVNEPAGIVNIYNNNIDKEFIEIAIEVLTKDYTRIPNKEINIKLVRKDISASLGDESEIDLSSSTIVPMVYNDSYSIDSISTIHNVPIYERGRIICTSSRFDGITYIPGSGYITISTDPYTIPISGTLTTTTDSNGIVYVTYRYPKSIRDIDVSLDVEVDTVHYTSTINVKGTGIPNYKYSDTIGYHHIKGIPGTSLVTVEVPHDCISPSSMELGVSRDIIQHLWTDVTKYKKVQNMIVSDNKLKVVFDIHSSSPYLYIARYPIQMNSVNSDSGARYVSL